MSFRQPKRNSWNFLCKLPRPRIWFVLSWLISLSAFYLVRVCLFCKMMYSGVKAGIFVRDAKAICPHLIIFPYNFQAYEEVVYTSKHSTISWLANWLRRKFIKKKKKKKSYSFAFLLGPYNMLPNLQVADQFYNVLHKHCNKVQVCSWSKFLEFVQLFQLQSYWCFCWFNPRQ